MAQATIEKLAPLVLLGPNGSEKPTVFAFLHGAFTTNLRRAWDMRNKISEIRSRGSAGPVEFELKYRPPPKSRLVTYRIAIDGESGRPIGVEELLRWTMSPKRGRLTEILRVAPGTGEIYDEQSERRVSEIPVAPDLPAVSSLGQLSRSPRVAAPRRLIMGWCLPYLNIDMSAQRLLQQHGYYRAGLPRLQVATEVAAFMDIRNNRSRSFQIFRDGLRRLVSEGDNGQTD